MPLAQQRAQRGDSVGLFGAAEAGEGGTQLGRQVLLDQRAFPGRWTGEGGAQELRNAMAGGDFMSAAG